MRERTACRVQRLVEPVAPRDRQLHVQAEPHAEGESPMITSVTSATMAMTSAVSIWGLALSGGGILLVIGLLVAIELLGSGKKPWHRSLRTALAVAAAPLTLVFAISILTKVSDIVAAG